MHQVCVVDGLVLALVLQPTTRDMLDLQTDVPGNGPIEGLIAEHKLFGTVLDAFDRWSEALLLEGTEDRLTLRRFLSFFADFVDGAHHVKEEKVLFATMTRFGLGSEMGPIHVMHYEHEEGRALLQDLRILANQPEAWDKETCGEINAQATTYVTLQRNHMHKEERMVFPLARARLTPAAWKEIEDALAAIDEENECAGMYDENLTLAENLILH